MTVTLHPARKAGRVLTLLSLAGLCAAALPAQAGITALASFTAPGPGTDGSNPIGGVTFDGSGNLFGTTYGGGTYGTATSGGGTVYEIKKGSNTITTLDSFTGDGPGTNGFGPHAGVTFDNYGNLFGTTLHGGDNSYGTVYEIKNGSSTITTLAPFTDANGSNPDGGVIFDSSGNLFGTTFQGGTSGYGTVYEIKNATSTITTLASFTGAGTNGSNPIGGVTFDGSGNLFGTTNAGGTYGAGTVYEIATGTTTIKDLDSFTGTNGKGPLAGMTFDNNGNLFGTTQYGGTSNYGTVYEIKKGNTTITDFASFTGFGAGNNGAHPFGGVTFDSSGNLFGTTHGGGATNHGTVYEIAQGTSTITTLDSFTGTGVGTDGAFPDAGVTLDSSGNLFGTTENGGAYGYGTVYEIAGAGSPSAAPEPSQFAALGLTTLGVGGLLLRARKRRQNVMRGV